LSYNLFDTSGNIKEVVTQCNDLWDSVYQNIISIVNELKQKADVWQTYVSQKDELLAKLSRLSLRLQNEPHSKEEVEKTLESYWEKVRKLAGQSSLIGHR